MKSTEKRVLELLREALENGRSVEIEGLGTFQPAPGGGYDFIAGSQPHVFIAYVEEDLVFARRLAAELRAGNYSPWLDKEKLLAGQNWPRAIERAIDISDAFVACFSPRSVSKRGYFQAELRYALDCARRLPMESVFVVPVRIAVCEVPEHIAKNLHYIDLFPDWERGMQRLLRTLRRARRRIASGSLQLVQT
jgi:hypothetical protein